MDGYCDVVRGFTLLAIQHSADLALALMDVPDADARAALRRHYLDVIEEHLERAEENRDAANALLAVTSGLVRGLPLEAVS